MGEKHCILGTAGTHTDEILAHSPNHYIYQAGDTDVTDQDLKCNYHQRAVRTWGGRLYGSLFIRRDEEVDEKPINYEKIKEVSTGKDKSSVLLHGCLVEVIRKCTNTNSDSKKRTNPFGSTFYNPI